MATGQVDVPEGVGTHPFDSFWTWPEGRRGYFLADGKGRPNAGDTVASGFQSLVMVDLDAREELDRVPLTPMALYPGSPHTVVVDREAGRVFVADGLNVLDASTGGGVCAYSTPGFRCFTGVQVFDAASLESLGRIALPPLRVDGALLAPMLRAMTFTDVAARGGKLHVVVEDWSTAVGAGFPVVDVGGELHVRGAGGNLAYALQFDVESRRLDWMVRLEACRFSREQPIGSGMPQAFNRPNPAAIFARQSEGGGRVYVGCHSSGEQAVFLELLLDEQGNPPPAGAPVQVHDPGRAAAESLGEEDPSGPPELVTPTAGIRQFAGPEFAREIVADPVSGRFLLKVVDKGAHVWWVFDSARWEVLATVGIGPVYDFGNASSTTTGFNPDTGRLYTLAPYGLFLVDIRRNPVPQALVFPEIGALSPTSDADGWHQALTVQAGVDGRPARVYWRNALTSPSHLWVVEDALPMSSDPEFEAFAGRTLDIDELEGVTDVSLDGAARGYGFRAILLGGLEGAARVGPADPVGQAIWAREAPETFDELLQGVPSSLPPMPYECLQGTRELVLGSVGPDSAAVVDGSGARGTAQPVLVNQGTRTDAEAPVSRCSGLEWQQLWQVGLFGQPPLDEPTAPWLLATSPAECVTSGEEDADQVGDASALAGFAAAVHCEDKEASGYGYARGVQVDGVQLGEALSSFRIYRDPGRGIVARVESVARGFHVPGLLRIDTVRGAAESWANGRRQWVAAEDRDEGYDPNCDLERTAGTCFRRHVFGLWTPGYSCGPCGDEEAMLERMNRGLGAHGRVRLREPDPELARGAENGFTAAITKPDHERFSDLVLNADLLQTVVPTLEIVRYAAANKPRQSDQLHKTPAPRGRQIYQLAGVEVSSSYGIQCLLVYDEESNTCGAPAEVPGSIVVSLQDGDGAPLAGGGFELRQDVDADGVLGLVDTLVADGACVTADDGIGTCRFENLQPGAYLVSQVAAPPGYAKSDEPWVSEVASGEERTVVFTNVSNVSTIEFSAEDADGNPLSGATFAAYPDPDADGKVAPGAEPAATCTTDESGSCTMSVPAGSYVLVQTGAPGGLEGIEPVPFTFASGGQVAAVTVTNYPPQTVDAPPPAAGPIDYSPPVGHSPPVESIDDYTPPAQSPEIAPGGGIVDQVGGTVVQVIRAPGDALRLLSRDPKQAAASMAALALFCLAVMAVRRRQQAMALIDR